ncbi:MAG: hypothetical protein ACFCBW_06325 [Candidatus Competibacterales bacterium]
MIHPTPPNPPGNIPELPLREFSDFFVLHLLGKVAWRRYTGHVELSLEEGHLDIEFQNGVPSGIWCEATSHNLEARLLWQEAGGLRFHREVKPHRPLDGYSVYEQHLAGRAQLPAMSQAMMALSVVEGGRVVFVSQSQLAPQGLEFFKRLTQPMATETLCHSEYVNGAGFWPSFHFLVATGQVVVNHDAILQPVLVKLTREITQLKTRFEGPKVGAEYQRRVVEQFHSQWPDYAVDAPQAGVGHYGTAPYRDWLSLLAEVGAQVGKADVSQRSYEQAFAHLSAADNGILGTLL